MALNDIRPWRSPTGAEEHLAYAMATGETFWGGEPVVVNPNGWLILCASDPAAISGIAAHQSMDAQQNALPRGTPITVYGPSDTQVFRCDNFATDGAGTPTTPARTHIGETAGLVLSGLDWFVDTGAANHILVIDDILDENRNRLADPNILFGTATTVLFRFL